MEAHGKVVRKNNHRARQSGSWGADRNNFCTVLEIDNMYNLNLAGFSQGKDPYK